jgi:hypothetical protein
MIVISILEADEFGDELYPIMRDSLTGLIRQGHVGVISAAGDSRGMIYRLFSELAIEYPEIFFTILLSNDNLAYEEDGDKWPHLFSLDGDIAYGNPRNSKQRRRKTLIERSDIIFCLKEHSNGIRKNNFHCDIIAL